MVGPVPLDASESLLWRSFIRCAMTLPRLLDQDLLEETGLTRSVDPDDRRATMATLTAQGQRALQRAYPKHLASVRRRVVDHIDTAETTALGPVLERLAELTETPRCLGEDAGHLP
jgi:hypothetical protein